MPDHHAKPDSRARRGALQGMLALPLATTTLLAGNQALAQGQTPPYPNRPLRIVVGFPAGSTTDAIARVFAEQLRAKLGQPVTVENRAGANGVLGVTEVARAAPDGYTILVTNSSSITVNPQVYKKIPYAPERDFVPLAMAISAPFILTVNPANERTASIQTVADLVALAKSKPGQLSYGSGGVGNLAHLGFELINKEAGIRTTHVPYKSSNAAQLGMLGKEIDLQLDTPTAAPHVKAGKLRALAVTTRKRWADLPDVPTMEQAGFPGFDVSFWLGALVPAQTPPAIIQTLYEALQGARDEPNALRQLQMQGNVELMAPQAFAARIKAETAAWGEVIRREKIELE